VDEGSGQTPLSLEGEKALTKETGTSRCHPPASGFYQGGTLSCSSPPPSRPAKIVKSCFGRSCSTNFYFEKPFDSENCSTGRYKPTFFNFCLEVLNMTRNFFIFKIIKKLTNFRPSSGIYKKDYAV